MLRDLSQRAPDTLQMLEEAKGLHLYDVGALIPVASFTLGWIALAFSTFLACQPLRRAAALVIMGFFAIPLISATFGPLWGGVLGNLALGSG